MEFVGRILLMGQWHEQFYEIVKKKEKIQHLINPSHFTQRLAGLPTPKPIENP